MSIATQKVAKDMLQQRLDEADAALRRYVEAQLEAEYDVVTALERLYLDLQRGIDSERLGGVSGFAARGAVEYVLANIVDEHEVEAWKLHGEPIRSQDTPMDDRPVGSGMPARHFLASWDEARGVVAVALEHFENPDDGAEA
jgi:hypothetical protein